MVTFGERLKRIREKRGWTLRELAERSGVPYETIYRCERGTHQEPRVSVAAHLARALGVSLDVLAGVYDDNDPDATDGTPQPTRRRTRRTAAHAPEEHDTKETTG
jgi:transcriptional regulator with XRE-family HTH domain